MLGLCLWLASDHFFSPLAAPHPPWSRFFVGSLVFYPWSWQKNATLRDLIIPKMSDVLKEGIYEGFHAGSSTNATGVATR